MTTKRQLDARVARFIEYIKERRVASEIAVREGMDEYYANRLRTRIALENGLPPLSKDETKALDAIPFGLDEESKIIRRRLADALNHVVLRHPPEEVARMIGIPQKLHKRALEAPYRWDWTLGQMQRLAKARGKPFPQFIRELV